jgi:uncharacterized protein YcfL
MDHLARLFLLYLFAIFVVLFLMGCSTPIERIKQHKQIVVSETLMQARPICSQEQQGRSIVVYTCR